MMRPGDSRAELRRALRALPAKRRRALARAVREGRAVDDPRDAASAVAWARRIQAVPIPGWLLPREKPHGRRAVLWLLHGAWISAVVVAAVLVPAWRAGGIVRWRAHASGALERTRSRATKPRAPRGVGERGRLPPPALAHRRQHS